MCLFSFFIRVFAVLGIRYLFSQRREEKDKQLFTPVDGLSHYFLKRGQDVYNEISTIELKRTFIS